jgi:tape measure domain
MASMGAGTNEIGEAMVQLSQGVSKGRFELEDVKSIMEKIPGSANIFAESLGRTTKEFYDMISAGQLGRAEIEKNGGWAGKDLRLGYKNHRLIAKLE